MDIIGKRVIIKKLELEDVFQMRNWGFHKNPLLSDYNFPDMTDNEIKKWYKIKTSYFLDKYYGVKNGQGYLLGYLGIKNIRLIKRESTLGIVFDPDKMNKGYGTEALSVFLNHYFTEMNMKKMYLEVAEFNTRAKKVYEKVGFKEDGYYLDVFFNNKLDLSNPYYLDKKSSFVIDGKKIYNYIYKMKLEREVFFSNLINLKEFWS